VAVLAIVVVSACGAEPDARERSAGSPQALVGTTTPSLTAPASSSSVTAPQESAGEPQSGAENACTASMLTGTIEPQDAGAGSRHATLLVHNKSKQVCTLFGYGGLNLFDTARNALPTLARRSLNPVPTLVRLRPGAAAGKTLHWTVVATGDEPADGPCQPSASGIDVVPPDEDAPLAVTFEFGPVCDHGRIETSAYFPR
jgi:hypothetical protein